ncbi:DUF6221 family protein [Streptacidiphilus sp. N1-3]|uniref:DUF6221 family protein n=1 Tax=Streptacidiphilus alkalitolerans TaxID=3342712 RepID=A0ABV6XBW3_9ACTN
MTDTDILAATIRRGLDALAATAQAAADETDPDWHAGGTAEGRGPDTESVYLGGLEVDLGVGEATPEHVANHDPRRVPARVARERRLLDLLLAEKHQVTEDPLYTPPRERDGGRRTCGRDARVAAYLAVLADACGEST